MVIVTEMAQDNFKTLIGKIKTLKLLVSRRFQGSEPIGHPRFDMREAVIALRDNRAEPDGTDPAHTEPYQLPWAGKWLSINVGSSIRFICSMSSGMSSTRSVAMFWMSFIPRA